jgi:Uma2 family endonuclease
VITWLGTYQVQTPGLIGATSGTVRLAGDNEFQPDVFLMIDRARGGHASLEPDGYVTGGPELAVEVSASTLSKDRNAKFRNYRDNGVREYILWRVEDEAIDWFVLRDGKYEAMLLAEGVYKSEVFPGLWLDPAALLRGDGVAVLATLQRGIASPEHAGFVEKLREA